MRESSVYKLKKFVMWKQQKTSYISFVLTKGAGVDTVMDCEVSRVNFHPAFWGWGDGYSNPVGAFAWIISDKGVHVSYVRNGVLAKIYQVLCKKFNLRAGHIWAVEWESMMWKASILQYVKLTLEVVIVLWIHFYCW